MTELNMRITWDKPRYSYEEVIGRYNQLVADYTNQSKRVVGREYTPEDVERYAEELFRDCFKNILHPSVIDPHRANFHQEEAKRQKELADYIARIPK